MLCPENNIFLIKELCLLQSFCPLSLNDSLSLLGRAMIQWSLLSPNTPQPFYFLHVDQLQVFVLIIIYDKKKNL